MRREPRRAGWGKGGTLLLAAALLAAGWFGYRQEVATPGDGVPPASEAQLRFGPGDSNRQVRGSGSVERLLRDDDDGSRHQRFILRLPSGQTVLVAHNIDLAPRIDGLRVGDTVEFSGEFEWNEQGGVVHWTHHDPRGTHAAGWLRHGGQTYQ